MDAKNKGASMLTAQTAKELSVKGNENIKDDILKVIQYAAESGRDSTVVFCPALRREDITETLRGLGYSVSRDLGNLISVSW